MLFTTLLNQHFKHCHLVMASRVGSSTNYALMVLYLSLVIASGVNIIGHVVFSPVEIKETAQGWFGLGPVAIHPDHQRQGHGTRLITAGLETLIDRGALGCVLIGDPLYYSRFGFINYGQVSFPPLPTEYVHWRSFSDLMPKGPITFAPAFSLDGEQPN